MKATRTRTLTFALAATFTMLIAPLAANAANINLNIYRPQTSGPQAGLEGPAGGLGETWNQESTNSASGLLDSTGAATTVGYASTNLGGPDTWGNPSLGLIRDGLRNFATETGNSQQFVINGLTAGDVYDVYLASANCLNDPYPQNWAVQRSNGEWSTPNVTTSVGPQTVNNTLDVNGTTWEEGNNYVLFENVVVDGSGEIVFNGFSIYQRPDYDNRLPLNGFQLVEPEGEVPEPATMALLGLAACGLGGYVRRRRA